MSDFLVQASTEASFAFLLHEVGELLQLPAAIFSTMVAFGDVRQQRNDIIVEAERRFLSAVRDPAIMETLLIQTVEKYEQIYTMYAPSCLVGDIPWYDGALHIDRRDKLHILRQQTLEGFVLDAALGLATKRRDHGWQLGLAPLFQGNIGDYLSTRCKSRHIYHVKLL